MSFYCLYIDEMLKKSYNNNAEAFSNQTISDRRDFYGKGV